jgi:hypothetical protein
MDNSKWTFTKHPELSEFFLEDQLDDSITCPYCSSTGQLLGKVAIPSLATSLVQFCPTCQLIYSGVPLDSSAPIQQNKLWVWHKLDLLDTVEISIINLVPTWKCNFCDNIGEVSFIELQYPSEVPDKFNQMFKLDFGRFCAKCNTVYSGGYE